MQAALIEERTVSEGVQTQPEQQEPPQPRKSRLVLPSWLRWLRTWLWEQFEEVLEVRICASGGSWAKQHPPVLLVLMDVAVFCLCMACRSFLPGSSG